MEHPTEKDIHSDKLKDKDVVCVRTSVIDTGVGISPGYQKNLFVAYSQEKASQQKATGGTGLGLVICKEIITQMFGKIVVTSELGVGSTFAFTSIFYRKKPGNADAAKTQKMKSFIGRELQASEELVGEPTPVVESTRTAHETLSTPQDSVYFPVVSLPSDDPGSEVQQKGTKKKKKGTKKRKAKAKMQEIKGHVLVVEDNLINQKVAKNLLRKHYKVTLADNGKEGLDLMKEQGESVDLILMDIFMPVMNGHEASKAIRQFWDGPILALTANATAKDRELCLASGMTDVVRIPFLLLRFFF